MITKLASTTGRVAGAAEEEAEAEAPKVAMEEVGAAVEVEVVEVEEIATGKVMKEVAKVGNAGGSKRA